MSDRHGRSAVFLLALAALALVPFATARAAVPSPPNCTIPDSITVSPNNGNECCFVVVVRDFANIPISMAIVDVRFTQCTVTFCPNQPAGLTLLLPEKTVRAFTNAAGEATFCICACLDSLCSVTILADGVVLGRPRAQNCVSCSGPACNVSPNPLGFGAVSVGDSADSTLTITNVGGGTLSGTVTESCPDFSIIGAASYSLGAGQSATVTVRFSPTSPGTQVCAINTGTSCQVDTATGIGVSNTPECQVSPSPLDFGLVGVGSSADRTLTITNVGGGTLSGTVTESCPKFSLIGPTSYSLGPGQSADITVRFSPTSTGTQACLINAGASCPPDSAIGTGTNACGVTAHADTLVCAGNPILLSASGIPPGGTYSWSGPNGFTSTQQNPVIPNAQASNSGTYTVTYQQGHCTPQASVYVQVSTLDCAISRPDSLPTLCSGTGNHLCATASGIVSYQWSLSSGDPGWIITAGQGTSCITYTAGGSGSGALFKVVLTTSGGCRDSCFYADSCIGDAWCMVRASGDTTVCAGGTILLNGEGSPPGGTYWWTGPNGFTSNEKSPVITNAQAPNAGTYVVYYITAYCSTQASVTVQVGGQGCTIFSPDSLPTLCSSTGNQLCVANSDTVQWSVSSADPGWAITGGQGTSCITYTAGGGGSVALFKAVMSWPGGCRDSCFYADSCVGDSGCMVRASDDTTVCAGGTILLNAEGSPPGGTYWWTGPNGFTSNEQSPVIASAQAENAGTYVVYYFASDCSTQASVTVQIGGQGCTIFAPDSLPVRCGSFGNRLCVTSPDAVSFKWSLDNSSDPAWAITGGWGTNCITFTAGSRHHVVLFKVVVTSSTGCRDSCVIADSCVSGTAGTEPARQNGISLYECQPNPFRIRTLIGFDLPRPGTVTLTVYGVEGREVARLINGEFRQSGHHEVEFGAAGLKPGVYFYQLRSGTFISQRKMMFLK